MRFVRKLHLYLSVFFAPLLIFFVGTGWYQTVTVERNKGLAEQQTWVSKLTSVHVDQVYPKEQATGEYATGPFKALVVAMSAGLLVTIGLGLYLAVKTGGRGWALWTSLGLGALAPVLILWLGQPR